jgi:hypothetical protein
VIEAFLVTPFQIFKAGDGHYGSLRKDSSASMSVITTLCARRLGARQASFSK